jgi:hypothetical protein
MDLSFQQIVIMVAVILLIVVSTIIGYMMYSVERLKPWPPLSNPCPDGWIHDISNNKCGSTGINVGSMITDISCSLTGSTEDSLHCGKLGITSWTDFSSCIDGWVRGNSANSRDPSNCYMLANVSSANIPTKYMGADYSYTPNLTYTPSGTMQDNVDWAKAFDISWDGLA